MYLFHCYYCKKTQKLNYRSVKVFAHSPNVIFDWVFMGCTAAKKSKNSVSMRNFVFNVNEKAFLMDRL